MRQPVMKLTDQQMRAVRDPLVRSGFTIPDELPDSFSSDAIRPDHHGPPAAT